MVRTGMLPVQGREFYHFSLSFLYRLYQGIMKKTLQGPTHRRLWCCQIVYSGGNLPLGSNVSSPSVLLWKKSNHVLSKAKPKASVHSFCFI